MAPLYDFLSYFLAHNACFEAYKMNAQKFLFLNTPSTIDDPNNLYPVHKRDLEVQITLAGYSRIQRCLASCYTKSLLTCYTKFNLLKNYLYSCSLRQINRKLWTVYETVLYMQQVRERTLCIA